ncbi:MAG TPA: hypothetical protein VJU82_14895 [Acidobacteriaceae bacterium]|nr:hypothetical protein [Acidobacteriaceae bacterium]
MSATVLMKKLLEIESALLRRDINGAHALVIEAEECLLQMERDSIQTQVDKLH